MEVLLKEVLIATIGSEAQVVTLSLLQLAELGYQINEVVVIHTDSPVDYIRESVNRLKMAFTENDLLKNYRSRFELLQGRQGPIRDVTTEAEAEDTFEEIFRVVRRYKLDGYRVHLNIAGGRKPMSIYGMVTAQMLFDEADRLWHLFSNKQLVDSRRLFPEPGDEYELVPVPVIRATDRPDLMQTVESAQQAVVTQEQLRHQMKLELFLAKLTKKQRQVVELMAEGLSNSQIAKQLDRGESTITSHLYTIYQNWRVVFGLPEDFLVRHQMVADLKTYFLQKKGKISN